MADIGEEENEKSNKEKWRQQKKKAKKQNMKTIKASAKERVHVS